MTNKIIELLSDKDLDTFGRLTVTSGDTTHDPLARPSVIMSAYAPSKGVDFGVQLDIPNNAQRGFFNGLGAITATEFHFGSKVFSYDLYAVESVSAKTFVDRTPFFEGDALAEIIKIKGQNGELDHKTLPEFARASIIEPEPLDIEKDGRHIKLALSNYPDKETEGRDIGAMVSMLVVAVQQLKDIVDKQQEQLLEVMGIDKGIIDKGIIDKGPDKE